MVHQHDNVHPIHKPVRAASPRHARGRPPFPPRPRKSWAEAFREMRPWLLGIALMTACLVAILPDPPSAPGFVQPEATPPDFERIAGRFTRCGRQRGYYCVIDGDTFMLGGRQVRLLGFDAAEVSARCPAEAEQAEASTLALLAWLNRGPFHMIVDPADLRGRYGHNLREVIRYRSDGSVEALADYMRTEGGARDYTGEARGDWC